MKEFPKKKSAIYSKLFSIRIEETLKVALGQLNATTDTDVQESIRIKLRELVKELSAA